MDIYKLLFGRECKCCGDKIKKGGRYIEQSEPIKLSEPVMFYFYCNECLKKNKQNLRDPCYVCGRQGYTGIMFNGVECCTNCWKKLLRSIK